MEEQWPDDLRNTPARTENGQRGWRPLKADDHDSNLKLVELKTYCKKPHTFTYVYSIRIAALVEHRLESAPSRNIHQKYDLSNPVDPTQSISS